MKLPFEVNGIWIVSNIQHKDVELTEFFEFVKGKQKPWKMTLPSILGKPHIGDDGKEITFRKGDLLTIAKRKENSFHLANVAPSELRSQLQYEIALARLDMRPWPPEVRKQDAYLIIDGHFREVD